MFDVFLNETIPNLLQETSLITFVAVYVAGILTSISPCVLSMVPVLVAILALVSATGKIGAGAALLFIYGLGHGTPLLIIGIFTGAIKKLSQVRQMTKNVNYVSGGILVTLGLYFLYLVS